MYPSLPTEISKFSVPLRSAETSEGTLATTHALEQWRPFHRPIKEDHMGLGRGILLWLIGIPLPIIILLAIFWR